MRVHLAGLVASLLSPYPVDANGYIELYQKIEGMSTGYNFNVSRDYLVSSSAGSAGTELGYQIKAGLVGVLAGEINGGR